MTPRYIELAEDVRVLQAEYEKRSAELDPLRWKLMKARDAAALEWQRAVHNAQTAVHQ